MRKYLAICVRTCACALAYVLTCVLASAPCGYASCKLQANASAPASWASWELGDKLT